MTKCPVGVCCATVPLPSPYLFSAQYVWQDLVVGRPEEFRDDLGGGSYRVAVGEAIGRSEHCCSYDNKE